MEVYGARCEVGARWKGKVERWKGRPGVIGSIW
jgi:hypothetical protein